MILVKDRTGSKSGTTDSTLVGVFDSKRPLYRLVKWLILHIFPPVFRLLYGFRVVGRIPEEKMENGCISVCNHVHKLDCVMLACVFQDYTMQFLSLESNLHMPVAGGRQPNQRGDATNAGGQHGRPPSGAASYTRTQRET